MKKLSSIFLLSLFAQGAYCQHSQLTLSEDFKVADKEYQDETVSHSVFHNNCFFTATNSGIGSNYKWAFTKLYDLKYAVTVSKFDRNMNKVKELSLDNGEKLFGPLRPELLLVNNKLCLAYFQSDNKSSFSLYLAPIDETDLTIKERKKICTIQQDNVGIFKMESVINAGLVCFANAADNTKSLISCNASPNTLQTFVIDNNLKVLKQTVLHTNTAGFEISSAVLTNDNLECMILASDQETKLVCNSPDGKKTEMKLNPSGSLVPYHTRASLSRDGSSIYVYSTSALMDREDKSCNGMLLEKLDCSTLKLSKALTYEFGPEFQELIYQKGGASKHKKEYFMYNFWPRLIELDNGNLAILGSPQQINVSTMTITSAMTNKSHDVSTTTFEIGPVMAFFLNRSGKTFEYALIPRKIELSKYSESGSGVIKIVSAPSISTSYAGFTASRIGDEIVIIYNDDKKNIMRGEGEKIAEATSSKDLVLAEALINKDRKLEYRKQIENVAGGKRTYFLGNAVPTSSSFIVFPIGKEGTGFNARKTYFSNWCFLDIK